MGDQDEEEEDMRLVRLKKETQKIMESFQN